MSNPSKIRIGLIGAGNIGNVHLQEFGKLQEECEFVAITDAYLPLAEQRAQQYGIPVVSASPEELIRRDDVDAVIVAVPNQAHAPLTILALEQGKHVLVEKPMGLDSEAAKEIVRAQKRTGKTVMVAHQMRWDPLSLQIKEQIDRGELGHIYTAKTGWYRRKGIPGWGTWFTQHGQSGGGPLIDIGVHMLDLAFSLWESLSQYPYTVRPMRSSDLAKKGSAHGANRIGTASMMWRILLRRSLRWTTAHRLLLK